MATHNDSDHLPTARRDRQRVAGPTTTSRTGPRDITTSLLQKMTASLPARELYVFMRCEGLDGSPAASFHEIATTLGCSRWTVSKQYSRAREQVRGALLA